LIIITYICPHSVARRRRCACGLAALYAAIGARDLIPGNWTVLSENFLVQLWLADEEKKMKKSRFSEQQIAFIDNARSDNSC